MRARTLSLLRRYGIRPSKRAGQHHVIDQGLLGRLVGYAELSRADRVLEIGAGTGNLTKLLAESVGEVAAIERDRRLFRILREELRRYSNVNLILGDALRVEFPPFDKVVANLPYGISSDITFRLLEHGFKLAVLMYQREFAERMVALTGSLEYGRLTVNVFYRARAELLEEVPPSAFLPQPEVTSTVVRLRPRSPPFEVEDERMFSGVVRALFQHRRKKVRNALFHSFGQIFPETRLQKSELRRLIKKKIPKELAEMQVMTLPPEKMGEISNRLKLD